MPWYWVLGCWIAAGTFSTVFVDKCDPRFQHMNFRTPEKALLSLVMPAALIFWGVVAILGLVYLAAKGFPDKL